MSALDGIETVAHPSTVPGAVSEYLSRELESGGLIEFEEAPRGWLAKDGETRQQDHRAYYWTPWPECIGCEGSGRAPSEKRPGNTIKCAPCAGSGKTKRVRVASVSTVLDLILPKPGLPPWSEARGIEGAFRLFQMGALDENAEPTAVVESVRRLKLGADAARDKAANRGTNFVHEPLREYMETGNAPSAAEIPAEEMGYYRALCRWLLAVNPEPEQVEELVCNPAEGYAGRSDLVARCDGFRIRFDAKSNEKGQIWPGAHVQVNLYEQAAIASGDEPCDLLKVVVFSLNGEFREMACSATEQTVRSGLSWWREIRALNSVCESANRIEREARR